MTVFAVLGKEYKGDYKTTEHNTEEELVDEVKS